MLESFAAKIVNSVLAAVATDQAKKIVCLALEELAKRTETKVDDEAVALLKKLWGVE